MVSCSKLLVVGIGGTTCSGSSTERTLRSALESCARRGAATLCLGGEFLAALPHYSPRITLTEVQRGLIEVLRRADGVILASPVYHGGISGLMKNALDTLEELGDDRRAYLSGRAVGCIVVGPDGTAGGAALTELRVTARALRGRPTPYGAYIDSTAAAQDQEPAAASIRATLERVGGEVFELANAIASTKTLPC